MNASVYIVLFCVVLTGYLSRAATYHESTSEDIKRDITSVNIDGYCQKTYGNGSYLCRTSYKNVYDAVCYDLECFDPRYTKTCVFSVPPQDTTSCGNGKYCFASNCKQDPHAEVTSDGCPLGDSMNPDVKYGMSCDQIVQNRPSLCRDTDVNTTWCCESCANVTLTDAATFSGPAVSADDDCKTLVGPNSYFCQATYSNDYSKICSSQLCFNPATGNCDPYKATDGVPCGNGKWCAGGGCVASTHAPVDPVADCMFGNTYEVFCKTNVVYPNIARYCYQYEAGCCNICNEYKNSSAAPGCQYGDKNTVVCQQHTKDSSIAGYCQTNEADCCETCGQLKDGSNADCPFGDGDPAKCAALIVDAIGPGNCYSQDHKRECCDTCSQLYNTSKPAGCEYGDKWKDYCAKNVAPPNVASTCNRYHVQCCESCARYQATGHPGCTYGDRDPDACTVLMNNELGEANCYNIANASACCGTCGDYKDTKNPACAYGDKRPTQCQKQFNTTVGLGHCYGFQTQLDCCRSCAEARNTSNPGCQFGDHSDFCKRNIVDQKSSYLCFQRENDCCETCPKFIISDRSDCKYGDKDPVRCDFQIPDEHVAARSCPSLGLDCCATCSKYGHPAPGGSIPTSLIG